MSGRIRAVSKARYLTYWQKALELGEASEELIEKGRYDAATLNAVHAAISAADAVCVFFLGQRSAARDHRESLRLLAQIQDPAAKEQGKRFVALLDRRRVAAYEERMVALEEAREALRSAMRFVEWARGLLPTGHGNDRRRLG